jgi:hypothetical protein
MDGDGGFPNLKKNYSWPDYPFKECCTLDAHLGWHPFSSNAHFNTFFAKDFENLMANFQPRF